MIRLYRGRIEVRVGRIPRPFPASVHAVTIFPFILYEAHVWDDACVRVHERYHWADQARWLVLPWLVAYLALQPFYGGGRRHPLEREAYRRQDLCEQSAGT